MTQLCTFAREANKSADYSDTPNNPNDDAHLPPQSEGNTIRPFCRHAGSLEVLRRLAQQADQS